jgi:hypothetical protein
MANQGDGTRSSRVNFSFKALTLLPVLILFALIQPALEVLTHQSQHAANIFAHGIGIRPFTLAIEHLAHDRLPIRWQADRSD